MESLYKIRKNLDRKIENKILRGDLTLIDSETGEVLDDFKINKSKYKLNLYFNKHFVKKFVDRDLNIDITKYLSDTDIAFLYRSLSYIDNDNIVDIKKMKNDYGISSSKLSRVKKSLIENGLLKESGIFLYLNPIVGIKGTEIKQDLILLFKESFVKYGVNIKYN